MEVESVARFGAGESLLGIVTRPSSNDDPRRPAVVLLNAGVIHRVGPHRMNVHLARRFADVGFTSFRMDMGGLGDSKASGDGSFGERAVADTRAALDLLGRETGKKSFVLFGLCSGADHGVATALVDPRVTGLVLVDPYTYVTTRSRARKLEAKVRSLGSVRRVAEWGVAFSMRKVRQRLEARKESSEPETETQSGREAPPAEVFGGWLRTLVDRGVAILALYSGALGERYNHEDQLFEVFPDLRGRVDRAWFPEANHTFTPRAAQSRLVEVTTQWLQRKYSR